MYKKGIILLILLLVFMMIGCANGSIEEKNVKGFLGELYQAKNTDEYQDLIKKLDEYYEENGKDTKDLVSIDGAEIFEPFSSKYEKYCTPAALEDLISQGYIAKYYQKAWEENCQFSVKEVTLNHNKKENQIYYTVKVEQKLDDGKTQSKSSEGIIKLNEKGLVDWFKITKDLG